MLASQLGITPQGAIGSAASVGMAAAQGGMNPLADVQAVLSLVGLFGASKPSNFAAFVNFSAGPVPQFQSIGTEAGKASPANDQAGEIVARLLTAAIDTAAMRGARFSSPVFQVVIGSRDPSRVHAPGAGPVWLVADAGPVGDPVGAASGAWNWLQKYASAPVSDITVSGLMQQAQGVQMQSPIVPGYGQTPPPGYAAPMIAPADYGSQQAAYPYTDYSSPGQTPSVGGQSDYQAQQAVSAPVLPASFAALLQSPLAWIGGGMIVLAMLSEGR